MYIGVPEIGQVAHLTRSLNHVGFTISRRYLLKYQDGSKMHMDRQLRDNLVLSGLAKESEPGRYAYLGPMHTGHQMSDLGKLSIGEPDNKRRFLPGQFIVEFDGKRRRERLETPEAYAARLNLYEAKQ